MLDDAVQEVFLVVHRRIDDFEGRSSETTWLYAVAVRVASTLRRSASRELARREKAGIQMHSESEADPERELSRAEAAALLDRLLDELDTTKRTVFVLAELEGVPVPEIAQIMDANVRTTHSRLRLARKRFNDALQRHHAQESGRARRATVRTLARRGVPAPAQPARARAAWAAVAVRISEGAVPMAITWTGAGAVATAPGFWLPFALTVGFGAGGLGVVAVVSAPEPGSPQPAVLAGSPDSPVPAVGPQPAVAVEPRTVDAAKPAVLPPAEVTAAVAPTKTVVRKAKPRGVAAGPSSTVSSLEAETALLESARGKIRDSDPKAALRMLDEHQARFPRGLLAAERKATRVKALCAAGRATEAERVAGAATDLRAVFDAACE